MVKLVNVDSGKVSVFRYLFPLLIFIFGCYMHFQRGYYSIGLSTSHAQGADDAYISFRYGWNLANHGTLSWNESGYRRTEGFTNPLWVYTSALWSLIGKKEWIYPLMVLTSVALSTALLTVLFYNVYYGNQQRIPALLGLVIIVATPAIWVHTTSGLESGLFGIGLALLAYLILFRYRQDQPPAALLLLVVMLGLLRSDAFIYLGIVLIAALISGSKAWKSILFGLLLSGLILLVWRQITFGEWLPNTAYAKVNFSLLDRFKSGLLFLSAIFLSSGWLIVLLLGAAGLWLAPKRVMLGGLFIYLAWLGYYLYIGGDHFIERHLIGLFILAACFSAPLWIRSGWFTRVLLMLTIFVGIALTIQRDPGRYDYFQPKKDDAWMMLGQAMVEDRDSYGVVVIIAAGKIPFYAGGDFIDSLGLNDPYLARLQRERFVPGHSAGDDAAALELAASHQSKIYSTFSYLNTDLISGPQAVRLWIDNRDPRDGVQYQLSNEQWQEALDAGSIFVWSIISQPTYVSQ